MHTFDTFLEKKRWVHGYITYGYMYLWVHAIRKVSL